MAFNSDSAREAARGMWEARWEAMWEQGRESELGPKGQQYISDKYGEQFEQEEPPYDEYNDFNDYEFDIEY